MSATATGTVSLWALLAEHDRLHAIWRHSRQESDRLAMAVAWALAITHPGGGLFDDGELLAGCWERCTATVLCSDHWPEREHLHYRGACLGCGWVSDHTHRGAGAENAAVEDVHDHTHPGWRDLPVLAAPPSMESPAAYKRLVERWRATWEPVLPAGWLDRSGPIRTHRSAPANRHVPGRAPGGGYDLASDEREETAGQLAFF